MFGGEAKTTDEFVLDRGENKTSDRAPSHLEVPTSVITGSSRGAFAEGGTAVSRRTLNEKDDAYHQATRISFGAHVATHDVNEHTKAGKKPWNPRVISGVLLWVLFVTLAVGCVMVYIKGTFASVYGIFYLTGYGCLSIGYYFLTMCFALLNRRHVERLRKADFDDVENVWNPPVVVNVVGYREDPDYFRRCLSSANRLTYSNLRVIVVSIDGNDKDDEEMAEIAMSIFPDAIRINMLSDPFADRYTSFLRLVPEVDFTCSQARTVFVVSQPHMGKREALYSSFKVAEKVGAEYIFNTDSDTILDPMAVTEMIRMTKGRPDVGAVAGELTIFNDTNWLGKLTASRYLIAFNVERASLGYHGVVNCISGPMGMYQAAAVVQVMDGWVHQHFLGVKCSFGDDRNLTNRILALGKKVVYTHRATGATETPLSYPRFVAQQTRWSKSFWREMYLQLKWSRFSRRAMYSLLDNLYGLLFPILVVMTILTVVFSRTWTSLFAIGIMTLLTPVCRALFVYVMIKRDRTLFYNVLYPFMYFSTLLAVKVVALFTIRNNTWGTSSRKRVVKTWAPVIPVFFWWGILGFGFTNLAFGGGF